MLGEEITTILLRQAALQALLSIQIELSSVKLFGVNPNPFHRYWLQPIFGL